MAVSFKKYFHLLIDKGMTISGLMEKAGFSAKFITRIKRDNYISLDTIEKICKTLNFGVDDILELLRMRLYKKHLHLRKLKYPKIS